MLIAGLGETGLAAALWCLRQGATIRIVDTRHHPEGLAALKQHSPSWERVQTFLGEHDWQRAELFDEVTAIVVSPGLSPYQAPLQALVREADARGIEVIGEIELFGRAITDMRAQGYDGKLLAISGTNGKTTVTALTAQLLNHAGITAQVAGNIGPAALTALHRAIAQEALPHVWVLEVSSFQLWATQKLPLDAAALLNISQDHIDWHGGFAAYVACKASLLAQTPVAILNRDDSVIASMALPDGVKMLTFGCGAPCRDGTLGFLQWAGAKWLCRDAAQEKLLPVANLPLPGMHNALNTQAALLLAHAAGGSWEQVLSGLPHYRGEPHRMQLLRQVQAVDFINDSKGTNVGATVAALQGLSQPVVLIAGGLAKGQDLQPIAQAAQGRVIAAVLIGQDASLLAAVLATVAIPTMLAKSMKAAVFAAFDQARPGAVVLLSPACASMDMFPDYQARGDAFIAAVTELALAKGEVA